jgi:predicted metal-dependent enzyme (double-stranded beta helix superfamily)
VHDTVNSWSVKGLEKRQLSCHETATHFKWFLHYSERRRFKVWLHQYKNAGERKIGFAEVPHNHRYSLASVILSGGFSHHCFERNDGVLTEHEGARRRYGPGDAYTVGWREVHKLSGIDERTLTLVVESAPVRNFSEAYYGASAEPVTFSDFVGMRPRLTKEMGRIVDAAQHQR